MTKKNTSFRLFTAVAIMFAALSCGDTANTSAKPEIVETPPLSWRNIKSAGETNGSKYFVTLSGEKLFNDKKFYNTGEFMNGYCVVSEMNAGKELFGVINTKGEYIIPCKIDGKISNYTNGYFKVDADGIGFYDTTGKEAIAPVFKFGYMTGENMVAVSKNGKKWGLMSLKGDTVLPFVYDSIGRFKADKLIIGTAKGYGFANTSGQVIIEPQYASVENFERGIALVKKGKKIGCVNEKNEVVIDFIYDDYKYVVDVVKGESTGNVEIEKNKRFMLEEGYIIVSKNNKWGYIDTTGKEIIPVKFDKVGVPDQKGDVYINNGNASMIFNLKTMKMRMNN